MIDLYRNIQFDLTEEEKNSKKFESILKDVCKNKEKTKADKLIKKPILESRSENCIVVIGIPKVPESKIKLIKMVFSKKILPKLELNESFLSMKLETDDKGTGTGLAILEFKNPEKAEQAANNLDRFILDKNHTFTSLTFSDFQNIFEIERNLVEPNFLEMKKIINWNDKKFIESKFVAYDSSTISYYSLENLKFNLKEKNKLFSKKEKILDIQFTSSGNYMIIMKSHSFEIYGGEKLEFITRFVHKNLKSIKFSNNEKYIISFNGTINEVKNSENVIVWDLYTGKKLRIFKLTDNIYQRSFDFSFDSNYCSGIQVSGNNKHLFVYELPSMKVVKDLKSDKRSQIPVSNPINCCWGNNENYLAVVNEYDNDVNYFNLSVFNIPSRENIVKNFRFEILDCDIKWSNDDCFLSLAFLCKGNKKRENIVNCCYVDFKGKNIFVSNLDSIEKGDSPEVEFSPNGKHFVLSNPKKKNKFDMEFYTLNLKDQKPKLLDKLENVTRRKVYFCPNSKFLILTDNKNVFFNEFKLTKGKIEYKPIKEVEMSQSFKSLKWSPCGRFVAFVRIALSNLDVTIHDCYGRAIDSFVLEKKNDFQWRDFSRQYKYEATKQQTKKFKNNIRKNYDKIYEEDEKIIDAFKVKERNETKKNKEAFLKFFEQKQKEWKESRDYRIEVLGYDEDEEGDVVEVTRRDKEELIDEFIIGN